MSKRLNDKLASCKAAHRTALIPFIMAYDPTREASQKLLNALPDVGADIIELGMPFSDPMADGKTIQAAGWRALDQGCTLSSIFEMVQKFRKQNRETPIILMGYYNPVHHFGTAQFMQKAADVGVDGLIIVDVPFEEEAEVRVHSDAAGLAWIRLVAPTTPNDRLEKIMPSAQGFAYAISVVGITGDKQAQSNDLKDYIGRIRAHTTLPVAVGFGVRTPQQARQIVKDTGAEAVVVGSALIDELQLNGVDSALDFVRHLRAGLGA